MLRNFIAYYKDVDGAMIRLCEVLKGNCSESVILYLKNEYGFDPARLHVVEDTHNRN